MTPPLKYIFEDGTCIDFSSKHLKAIEEMARLPCCHVSGEHDPTHFQEGRGICFLQKYKAYDRLCKELGINPEVKSEPDCFWCNNYPEKKKGEGLRLLDSIDKHRRRTI